MARNPQIIIRCIEPMRRVRERIVFGIIVIRKRFTSVFNSQTGIQCLCMELRHVNICSSFRLCIDSNKLQSINCLLACKWCLMDNQMMLDAMQMKNEKPKTSIDRNHQEYHFSLFVCGTNTLICLIHCRSIYTMWHIVCATTTNESIYIKCKQLRARTK